MLDFATTRLGRQFLADVSRIARSLERIADQLEARQKADEQQDAKQDGDPDMEGEDDG